MKIITFVLWKILFNLLDSEFLYVSLIFVYVELKVANFKALKFPLFVYLLSR